MLLEVILPSKSLIYNNNTVPAGNGSSWLQNSSTAASIEYRKRPTYSAFPSTPAQVSSVQDLFEFICSGPLLDKLGLTREKVAESIDNWITYGRRLCQIFQLNELFLTEPQKARLYHYYVPVFLWCEDQIAQHQSKFKDEKDIPPLVVYTRFTSTPLSLSLNNFFVLCVFVLCN